MSEKISPNGLLISVIILGVCILAIVGYLAFVAKPEKAVQQPAPISTPHPTEDQSLKKITTQDWQVYRNENYGFEFRYPKDYKIDPISKIEEGVVFNPESAFEFKVRLVKNLNKFEWEDPIVPVKIYFDAKDKTFKKKDPFGKVETLEPERYTESGEPIYSFGSGDVGLFIVDFVIPNYTKNFLVVFSYGGDRNWLEINNLIEEFEAFEENFKQILSTFRFID
jgi:hypothetical protein